jgi:hypothetical protein
MNNEYIESIIYLYKIEKKQRNQKQKDKIETKVEKNEKDEKQNLLDNLFDLAELLSLEITVIKDTTIEQQINEISEKLLKNIEELPSIIND